MTVKETLIYFLKTGVLKNIGFESPRETVVEILGDTDWTHYTSKKDKYPSIYKYDRVEFYFYEDTLQSQLSGVIFQPISTPAENGKLNFDYNGWNKNTELTEAINFLSSDKIGFEERVDKWNIDTKLLVTEGNVNIFFDCQATPGQYLLHKASSRRLTTELPIIE